MCVGEWMRGGVDRPCVVVSVCECGHSGGERASRVGCSLACRHSRERWE
ncbi:hypothetical protein N9P82_00790 [bacterium]|nr:hypothetical protein [bacterium]